MQLCHISQNLKNLNLVPDSFARLVWVIFYIYTLVMAGYCIVLTPRNCNVPHWLALHVLVENYQQG